ncbi:molybdopterin molybdotransferase MoeA [Kitasatospora sp. CM 4170]|uniref:molybdopterin molybdotransferase MoeA n=1 Tax=Kitasatospora TaxID=2063 RepID=UPI0028B21F33|nr:molybdopterin molybdotransferase MoeA [Kitasatospora sp. CM 4170]WNM43330.1 molybdopterin molybdotransferase MoeA [Kitasatospora sp. CM 4170]
MTNATRADTRTTAAPPRPGPHPATPTRHPAVPWEEARETARESAGHPLPAVSRALPDALGHVLAEPLTALTDLPPFDTSAMDGWAVCGPGPWRLLAGRTVLAGVRPEPLPDGTAVPIATGAQLPCGATAVLRREHGGPHPADGLLHHLAPDPLPLRRDVRPRGQECRCGEPLLPAGTAVTPAVLGLAAAAGYDTLAVHRRPTVELLVLGDELLDSGRPADGRIRDALGPLLPPWLRAVGADVIAVRRVADDLTALCEAIRSSPATVLVTTGSTAAGPVDFLHRALAEAGATVRVGSVAVRPGHPMLLAELPPATGAGRPRHLVGLPGNPLAAVAGTVTLAAPLFERLGGRTDPPARLLHAATDLPGHPHDTRLLPVRLTDGTVTPLTFSGPAMLRGLAGADALAAVPPRGLPPGAPVEVLTVPDR